MLAAVDQGVEAATRRCLLLDFRLDPGRRDAITERTLAEHKGGVPREVIEAVGDALQSGGAVFAILYAGPPAAVLDEAVQRSGGELAADESVDFATLAEAGPQLTSAVTS